MVKLLPTVIAQLGQKMFEKYQENIDPNGMERIFNYMMVSEECKDSALRQFAKMKEVVFYRYIESDLKVDFYAKSRARYQDDLSYPVAFRVPRWFIGYLMEYGVFRPKRVLFGVNAAEWIGPRAMQFDGEELAKERTIDILSHLLGFEEEDPGLSTAQLYDIPLDYVEVSLGRVEEMAGLYRFIVLGAKEMMVQVMQFELNSSFLDSFHFDLKKVRSPRVQLVSITYNINVSIVESDIVNFPYRHVYSVISAISKACPNVKRIVLRFKLPADFVEEDFDHVTHWLRTTTLQLAEEAPSKMHCGSDTSVVVAFRSFFPERKLRQVRDEEDPLSALGVDDNEEWEEDYDYAVGSIAPESLIIARRLVVPLESQAALTTRCFLVGVRDENDDFNNNHQVGPPARVFEIRGYDDTLLDEMDDEWTSDDMVPGDFAALDM